MEAMNYVKPELIVVAFVLYFSVLLAAGAGGEE